MTEITGQHGHINEIENSFKCEVCEQNFVGAWTDFFGEATCIQCGTPYQIREPSGAKPNQKYPQINIDKKWISVFKEYWQETRKRHREGTYLLPIDYPGLSEEGQQFRTWLQENHPELLKQ